MAKQKIPKQKYSHKPDSKVLYDTVIIGTGPTGWATAMYSGRLGLKTLIIGEVSGGKIILAHQVENYPGIPSITGQELAEKIENHARGYNIDILSSRVEKVEKKTGKGDLFEVKTSEGKFTAKTIIFCTGTNIRKLDFPGVKEFDNKGVHYCALCDGHFYKGKERIGIIGGSDSAAKDALLLTEYAKKVFIIYRKEKIRAEEVNIKRIEEKIRQGKIEIINNTNVKEVKGKELMTHVILDKPYKGSKEFRLDALFIDVGYLAASELAEELGVKLNEKEEIIIDRKGHTNIQGIFAAGDVTDSEFKQAITGVGEGITACFQAYKYVKNIKSK